MGKKKHPWRGELLWFHERLLCCCKIRAEALTLISQISFYFVIPFLVLSLAAACITIGALFINSCSYNTLVPIWVIASAVTPILLLLFALAIKQKTQGTTCRRLASLLGYGIFLGWLVTGCVWVYDTWTYATFTCQSCCDSVLINFAFALTFAHWIFAILAAIPNVYFITKMLCCGDNNSVEPLKS